MIRVVGPVQKHDGYGEMARHLCFGLIECQTDLTIRSILFGGQPDSKNLKDEMQALSHFMERPGIPDTVIQCLTPDNFPNHIVNGAKNIAYCMWECTVLPAHWPFLLDKMDLILVPSEFCKEVFERSGVKKQVKILPLGTDTSKFDKVEPNQNLRDLIGDNLAFYSIFEWSERKNPAALFNAYYSSFGVEDKVTLIVKSYTDGNEEENKRKITEMAGAFRSGITRHKTDYPKVICITDFLPTEKILEIHKTCDVYLGPVRGEGWSIPMFDAALAGNHIITTRFSSHTDFLDTYSYFKFQNYDLCNYQLEPVHSMHSLYTPNQEWASIDMHGFCRYMKSAYEGWKQHRIVPGTEHRKSYVSFLKEQYSRKKIALKLKEYLKNG